MDLLNPAFPHRAFYDDEGNIILPSLGLSRRAEPEPMPAPQETFEEIREPAPQEMFGEIAAQETIAEAQEPRVSFLSLLWRARQPRRIVEPVLPEARPEPAPAFMNAASEEIIQWIIEEDEPESLHKLVAEETVVTAPRETSATAAEDIALPESEPAPEAVPEPLPTTEFVLVTPIEKITPPPRKRTPRTPLRVHVQNGINRVQTTFGKRVDRQRELVCDRIVALRRVTRETLREGGRQYRVSVDSGRPIIWDMADDVRRFFRKAWNFLAQPVWVPTRKKQIKQYSRGTLFILDIFRFGGTFAVIFLGLFVALNYDSFWQIAESRVTTILESPSIESPEAAADDEMLQTLKATAPDATPEARERGELLSFLPNVGPPENRVLIPKLKLNVPLVEPKIDSLLRQDWEQVEIDIQDALVNGVVHYPGTARPGQAGNFFVTGHSSYYPWAPGKYKTIFARLQDLVPGDEYWVYYKGDRHRYIITEKKEVSPSDITVLDQPENRRIATLMTCTPVGTTLRRLIIVAQEVDPTTGEPLAVGQRGDKGVSPKLELEALPI